MSVTTITLARPLSIPGPTADAPARVIGSIDLDLDKLTGADVEFASREATIERGGTPTVALVLDSTYHAHLAARASGHHVQVLRLLSAPDFMEVLTKVQGFLLGTG